MEEIFIAIMERIAEKIPELSYIDEDYGQLEAGAEEDHYPVTFPCVLIGNAESDWNDLGYGVQKSESFITITHRRIRTVIFTLSFHRLQLPGSKRRQERILQGSILQGYIAQAGKAFRTTGRGTYTEVVGRL